MPRRAKNQYRKPKKPFDKARIEEEKGLMKKYGLRKKREIWRAAYRIDKIRAQAKKLILKPEEQPAFLARLAKLGLLKPNSTIDDALALTKEKLLERRLQSIVYKLNLAKTPKEARQLILHRKILVGGKVVNIPSYLVNVDEETKIERVK